MTTQSALHHMLAILAGDVAPSPHGDAAVDHLARLMGRLGLGGQFAPDPLSDDADHAVAPWFVRVTFPGIAPPDAFIVSVAIAAGLQVESLALGPAGPSRWLLIAPQSRSDISSAVARLRAAHRIHAVPFRTVEDR